jgi:curved DNA-binding protein CbpA
MTPNAPDYYKLLGVSPSATGDEITRAYRNAMKRVHPDAQQPDRRIAAEERAKQLNHAYTTLSRPDRRRQYDTELRASMVQEQIMGRYVGGFGGPNSNAADPFAQRKPRRSDFLIREQRQSDRFATISLFFVFGCLAIFLIASVVAFSIVVLGLRLLV